MKLDISQEYLDRLQEVQEIEGIYLANSLQQGFIYHFIRQGKQDDAYIVQGIWEYNNQLDVNNLQAAWSYAQQKYPSLRLRFSWEEEIIQIVDKEAFLNWQYIDLSNEKNSVVQEDKIKQIQQDDRNKPYKLELGNLFRIYLIKQKEDLYTCIFSNHHIIMDGWSSSVLLEYVHDTYLRLQSSEKIILSIDRSYKEAQRYFQNHSDYNKSYWEECISTIEERSDLRGLLNITSKNVKINQYNLLKISKERILTIEKTLYLKLKDLGKNKGITLNAILQYVWHKVLNIYGNSNHTVTGITVSGRNLPIDDIENSVGMYINTLPLIFNHQCSKEKSIIELIRNLQDNINEINSRSVVNLAELQKNGERLFDSLFIYENYPNLPKNFLSKLKVIFKEGIEKLDYPLAAIPYEMNNQLNFKIKFAGELFTDETIHEILLIIENLLKQIVNDPYKKVEDLSYLTSSQYEEIIYRWNATDKDYPKDKMIHELFEEQVERTPDNIAIIYEDKKLTYKELNEKANQLAHYLRNIENIKPDTLIALCLDRSEYMLIAILAILKAGAAYVPMDPSYPDERIEYILKDTEAKIVLTNEAYLKRFNTYPTIAIDRQKFPQELTSNPSKISKSNNLAYVIYTSGTTGNPKGVMIEHKAYIATIDYVKSCYFAKLQQIKTYSTTNYVFDIFGLEYGLTLLSGGTISLGGNEFENLDCKDFDFIQLTPSVCDLKLDDLKNTKNTKLIIGGESLSCELLNRILSKNINIINAYGPTETTIWSASKQYLYQENISQNYVSLGKPFANEKVYVLDKNLKPLPVGAIGELYIGGKGLARGYLNQPELTAERFMPNPFQPTDKNSKLYKTGDLVRWLANGELEYIGRNDFQVKIRGYRIELEEIETALSNYEGVKQSIVLIKEQLKTGSKYIVGYYVSENKLDDKSILQEISNKLPEYMVPNILVHMESLPLTVNGKLDRKALPNPELTDKDNYIAPRNPTEVNVYQLWLELLVFDQDKVGVKDDFFRLGGNSIIAIKLVSKINKDLNVNLAVSSIFQHNTVEKMADYLNQSQNQNETDNVVIEKAVMNRPEDQTLSFAQERLWFIEKYEEGTSIYNIPMIFELSQDVRLDVLEASIKKIIFRHEVLRTVLKEDVNGHAYQLVLNNLLEIVKIRVNDQAELDHELQQEVNYIFNLTTEYPIRVHLYELGGNHYLSIVIHHIAFDGWSVDLLLKEIYQYYNSLDLSELPIQYKDFAIWQRNYLTGEKLAKQLSYWRDKLNGYETLNLITDKPRPSHIDYQGKEVYLEIDESISNGLRELAKELKVSLYSLLLAGYYLFLKAYSNQDNIVVGTPIANRQYNQVENLIGLFINSLALRMEINPNISVKEFIQKVGAEIIEAQEHQDLPFEKLVNELGILKDTSRHPIFQVMFVVQDFGSSENIATLLKPYTLRNSLYNVAKFDISVLIDDSQSCLKGSFNYATSLYNEETIIAFTEIYKEILKKFVKLGEEKISDLSYLSDKQYEQIIYRWNATDKDYTKDKTIQELFEEQVERTPNNIAVIYEDKKLTYQELNEKANQLAHYLRNIENIKPDTLIALCLDRSEYMLIAILAVLKAGAAYVPMDPTYPDDRIKYIIKDTEAKIVLTNDAYLKRLSNQSIKLIAIDRQDFSQESKSNLNKITRSNDLAYVIYTSGTTGNPKGVMIEHKAYVATIDYMKNCYFNKQQQIKTYSTINYVFDIFGLEYGLPLLSGGIIHVGTSEFNSLDCTDFDFVQMTPSLCDLKLDDLKNIENTKLIIGGENLSSNLLDKILNKNINIINAYGPTETTIWSASKQYLYQENDSISFVSFGKPFANEKMYVLDKNLKPQPVGAIGELYIGGIGLARGYLNQPELTAERFIINPFQSNKEKQEGKNSKLYKTGDLVRWLTNGELEYIGRNDFQLKIRGYRIELGEIENILSSYDEVIRSVVVAKENKNRDKYLVGYYVSENKLDEDAMLNHLRAKLPDYMVPTALVHMENLPLTVNGKLDRKALPDPELTDRDNYVPPRTEIEKKVCEIWSEILGFDEIKIGIEDDFFRLGGDSILAIRLVNKLNKELKSKIRVRDVFEFRSISKLILTCETNIQHEPEAYVPFSLIEKGVQ